MSWTGDTRTVMNYIAHGACDFLIKPLKVKELRNIWQHVFRKQMADQIVATESKSKLHNSASEESITSHIPAMNDEREIRGMITDIRDLKKSRLQWTRQLHHQFIAAVNVIGLDKAAPKKILEIMHVKHLTREQVASHLQKYRLYLKRSSHVITKEVVKLPVSNQNSGLNEIEPENNTSSSQDEDQNNIGMDITDYSYYKGESSSGSHCVIGDPGNCFHETFHDLNYWDSSKQEAGSLFWNFST
ncbi:hypothetical protein LUZ60_014993 [Juncus effusus]|nr:hypothetical protein LUZ60_014993 [Juncus effusus]